MRPATAFCSAARTALRPTSSRNRLRTGAFPREQRHGTAEVAAAVVRCAVLRSHALTYQIAVGHMTRVDSRLLVLMWHLADRWGKVTKDGIVIPLKLTHQVLGRIVGAQRPSVTTALKALTDRGALTRAGDGSWLLHGEPPDEYRRISEPHHRVIDPDEIGLGDDGELA